MSSRPSARASAAPRRSKTALPGGKTAPSPRRTERTTAAWLDSALPVSENGDYGTQYLPVSNLVVGEDLGMGVRAGIPTIVWFSPDIIDEKVEKFEDQSVRDERVGLASRWFNCIRITISDLPPSVAKQYGANKGPSFLFLDAKGKQVKLLKGWNVKGNHLFNVMNAQVKSHYKANLKRLLTEEAKLLAKVDKAYWDLEDAKYELTELQKRDGKSAERQKVKLIAKIEKLEKEYEAVQKSEADFIAQFDRKGEATADN